MEWISKGLVSKHNLTLESQFSDHFLVTLFRISTPIISVQPDFAIILSVAQPYLQILHIGHIPLPEKVSVELFLWRA